MLKLCPLQLGLSALRVMRKRLFNQQSLYDLISIMLTFFTNISHFGAPKIWLVKIEKSCNADPAVRKNSIGSMIKTISKISEIALFADFPDSSFLKFGGILTYKYGLLENASSSSRRKVKGLTPHPHTSGQVMSILDLTPKEY